MNPFGVSLYFLHLVKKLMFARVAPIFLYILLRSLGILLQEYVSKEKSFGDTIANKERNKLLVTIPIEITLSYFCRTFRLS